MRVRTRYIRGLIQFAILSLVTVKAILHQIAGGGPKGVASIHALCPFGGIETFYAFVTAGEFVKKTFYSNLVLLGGSTLLVFLLGRIFCGWICALGTLQDIFGGVGKKIFKERRQVPEKFDGILRYLKYIVLIGIIYFTWKTGKLVLNDYDPFAAYSHITAGWDELLGEYLIGFSILVAMLVASLFYDRLFCRYICPLGAFYAIIGKFSLFKIKRVKSSCIDCGKCDKVCPAGLNISASDEVKIDECLGCMECVNVCPTKQNSLEAGPVGRQINKKAIGVLGVAMYFGIILITKSIGVYQETESNISKMINGNPNNIRGWMSVQDLSDEFGIPLKDIYSEIGLTQEQLPPETSLKNSEKLLVAKGIEFDHDTINESVFSLLGMTPELEEEGSHDTGGTFKIDTDGSFDLRGNMTITMIAEKSGMTTDQVIKKLEVPLDVSHNMTLKNLSAEYGVEMGDIKERWAN